jgi:hypothetical protein
MRVVSSLSNIFSKNRETMPWLETIILNQTNANLLVGGLGSKLNIVPKNHE